MSDGPSTSWANWAWQACGEGRLVEVSEVRLQVFGLTARAERAEAERDRLREALEQFLIEYDEVDLANAEPSSLTEAVLEARAALKGESHE